MSAGSSILETLIARERLLRRLASTPARAAALVEERAVSRSTVDRGLAELREAGLVERHGDHYRPTIAGTLALTEFDRLADRTRDVAAAGDLLAALPGDAAVDLSILEDATVVVDERSEYGRESADRSQSAPAAEDPERTIASVLEASDRTRAVTPTVDPSLVSFSRGAIRDGLEAEVTLPSSAVGPLLADLPAATVDAIETGRLTIRETPSPPSYALLVADAGDEPSAAVDGSEGVLEAPTAIAALAVCVGDGLYGVVYNDTPAALEWATARLERVWTDSQPLPVG